MSKGKYYYDKKSLSYKKIKMTKLRFIKLFLSYFFPIILLSSGLCLTIFYFYETPRERESKINNQFLLNELEDLTKRMEQLDVVLNELGERDDNIYRAFFGEEPVGKSIRNAGFGGANRYKKYEGYEASDLVIKAKEKIDKLSKKIYIQSVSYDELTNLVKNKSEMFASIPAIQPVSNVDLKRKTSGFGHRIDPIYKTKKMHYGLDFAAPIGTPVYATGNGTIKKAKKFNSGGYGKYIIIDHGYDYKTLYAHLDELIVKKGSKVHRGDVIGYVGNTGKSTAPHLHYEVHYKDQKIDPINFFFDDLNEEEYDLMLKLSSTENQSFD
ncbi:MAG: hypothetical protein CBC73_00570 [Flavobacteriales bacterium TMED113]|nr:MAG: hypothetical protein CBC73_00570 [Flavobacteriales bacterium TMED113]